MFLDFSALLHLDSLDLVPRFASKSGRQGFSKWEEKEEEEEK